MRWNAVLRMLVVSLFSLVFLTSAHAQYRASLQGTVTDPQGAVLPDASVTLTNKETGRSQVAQTSGSGVYNFNGLSPSAYSIKVEKAGFKQQFLDNVHVIAEQANAVDVVLQLGQATETVTVTDATPAIDTETSNLSGTVSEQEYQKLPSFGRDPFQLLQLAPGAFGDASQNAGGGSNSLPSQSMGAVARRMAYSKSKMAARLLPAEPAPATITTKLTVSELQASHGEARR